MSELTRLEKTVLGIAVAEAITKEERKVERIKKRIGEGVEEYGNLMTGRRDINKDYNQSMKIIDTLDGISRKLGCLVG